MKIFTATRENDFEFTINESNGESYLMLKGKKLNIAFQKKTTNRYVLKHNHQNYNISITKKEQDFEVLVNGVPFLVSVEDEHTRKMQEVIQSRNVAHSEKTVKAQIPGLIVDIMAETGNEIQSGQPLLILEAMKMENVIKAPYDCRVIQVMVKAKDIVNQNQDLLKIKPL